MADPDFSAPPHAPAALPRHLPPAALPRHLPLVGDGPAVLGARRRRAGLCAAHAEAGAHAGRAVAALSVSGKVVLA